MSDCDVTQMEELMAREQEQQNCNNGAAPSVCVCGLVKLRNVKKELRKMTDAIAL